jgi:hypothetical protein
MKVNIESHTNGKGYWSEEERLVIINRLDIGYKSTDYYPEDPFHGELRAYFEPSGFTVGSWNVRGYGLIYTDKLWMKEFKAGLRALGLSIKAVQNVSYSEQGMQGDDYVSMDVGPAFYASWKKLVEKANKA